MSFLEILKSVCAAAADDRNIRCRLPSQPEASKDFLMSITTPYKTLQVHVIFGSEEKVFIYIIADIYTYILIKQI